MDPWRLKIPVFGELFRKVAIARFARNFATMTRSGVPILQSLAIVGDTSGNWVIEDALRKIQDSVRSGKSVSGPMAAEPVFPPMVVQMVSVGEDSGSMEQMLGKIADFYEDEVQSMTEQLTALIEPLMIAFIGVIIGAHIGHAGDLYVTAEGNPRDAVFGFAPREPDHLRWIPQRESFDPNSSAFGHQEVAKFVDENENAEGDDERDDGAKEIEHELVGLTPQGH